MSVLQGIFDNLNELIRGVFDFTYDHLPGWQVSIKQIAAYIYFTSMWWFSSGFQPCLDILFKWIFDTFQSSILVAGHPIQSSRLDTDTPVNLKVRGIQVIFGKVANIGASFFVLKPSLDAELREIFTHNQTLPLLGQLGARLTRLSAPTLLVRTACSSSRSFCSIIVCLRDASADRLRPGARARGAGVRGDAVNDD